MNVAQIIEARQALDAREACGVNVAGSRELFYQSILWSIANSKNGAATKAMARAAVSGMKKPPKKVDGPTLEEKVADMLGRLSAIEKVLDCRAEYEQEQRERNP